MTSISRPAPVASRGAAPILAMLAAYLRPQALRVLALAVVLLGGIGLQLLAPQSLRRFIDSVTAHGAAAPLPRLWGLAGLFLLATAAAQAARVGAAWLSERVGWAATNRLRHDLAVRALRLDMDFHTAHTPGELIERLDGDVTALAGFFSEFVIQILGGAVLIAGVIGLLFAQDWRVGAALSVLALAAILVLRATRNLSVASVALERRSRADLAGFLEERIGGLDDIRANGGGGHVMRGLDAVTETLNFRAVRAAQVGRAVWVLTAAIFAASALTALIVGVYLFQADALSLGAVYLIAQYAALLREPLNQIGSQLQDVQRAAASLERVGVLMAMRPAVRDGPGVDWPAGAPRLSFEAVDFGYGDGPPVLRGISFALAPGQVLGLLGHTGGGKTSLIRLLGRLYDPTAGAIRLDGRDIREARLDQLRRRIGVVSQDVQIFAASVRDNVSLFDPDPDDARIVGALEDLGLGAWLARQPAGLDTVLAGASGLSAGEGQLLAFARILTRDPGLIVLDEASSRLDPAADRLVDRAVDRLLAGRSAIVIAHKLETVRRADRILILEAGRIVEAGDRTALAADPGSRLSRLLATAGQDALV